MQKLLRRSPCVLASSGLHSLPLSTTTFSSFGFFNKTSDPPKMTILPSPGASSNLFKVLEVPFSKNSTNLSKALSFSTGCCSVCTCSVEGRNLGSGRAWVVLKDCKGVGGRAAWFGTLSGGDGLDKDGFSVAAGGEKGGSSSDKDCFLVEGGGLRTDKGSFVDEEGGLRSDKGSFVVEGGGLRSDKDSLMVEGGSLRSDNDSFLVEEGGLRSDKGSFVMEEGGSSSDRGSFMVEDCCLRSDKGSIMVGVAEEGGGSSSDDDENVGRGKVERVQRRQRGGHGGGGGILLRGNPDLLTIPGVGPRNLRKLVEKGFDGVDQLKQFYKDKFFRESTQKMVEYLQSSVGIIHKNHAESITTFIKESVDKELKDDSSDSVLRTSLKKRITLCVEGNISVGKTTFLQRIANETIELQDLVEVVPEPIDKWQNIGPDHFNILDAFYADPQRYAYTFQNYVFVTRVMQERESSGGLKPLRLIERSIFSDRMVFVRAVHEAKWMNEMEISIYDSWFDPVVSCLPGLIPDGFIYLRASPDTCHKRMMTRKREEEGGVSLEYLRGLHEKHESWLFPSESGNREVLSASNLPGNLDHALHPEIRDRVFYLEGNHMHPSIQKVPALILNCEPNIDFNKDIDAKRQYALQVAKFFEFVKKQKEETTSEGNKDGSKSNQAQVLTPHAGGLWMPGAGNFPESALKALDLKKAMSLMSPMSR